MGYLFTVLAILNIGALVGVALGFWYLTGATLTTVETVIAEEVRKQDDRIEKRLQRAERQPEDASETEADGIGPRIVAGRPTR